MSEQLAGLIETWKQSIADFVALTRTLTPEQGALPTDLAGWDVHANVAHTAHLEGILAGAPEETIDVPPAPHVNGLFGYYTEQGVLARRDRTLAELADEIEQAAATRSAALDADPPTDPAAPAARTPGGVPWNNATLLGNRPLDVWMHEQDIRRAIGRPGNFESPAATHTINQLSGALPMVLGKRVKPAPGTAVRIELSDSDQAWTVAIGDDGRAGFAPDAVPSATITLTAEEFVLLAGGRRPASAAAPVITGDHVIARALLDNLAVTP